ncbi:RcnB family protein [Martelella alba]|uniref:Ni/Co efflux regulator RcnB n=1 Tax=Martelella alba TaxID=2590451 RepID=A0ABY2SS88_9HYPH|nr:RcnB family protein [Martelella alba]TKI06985.1 hypothetical protein FCN80_08555 [Martelella alba]
MDKLRKMSPVVVLFAVGCFASGFALAEGPGGPDGGRPPIEKKHGGPEMGRHFAYRGHDFERGKPAPQDFRGRDFRVDNWRDKGLPPPPEGQYWSYINGNYVLIAATTGIITSIILNSAAHR